MCVRIWDPFTIIYLEYASISIKIQKASLLTYVLVLIQRKYSKARRIKSAKNQSIFTEISLKPDGSWKPENRKIKSNLSG